MTDRQLYCRGRPISECGTVPWHRTNAPVPPHAKGTGGGEASSPFVFAGPFAKNASWVGRWPRPASRVVWGLWPHAATSTCLPGTCTLWWVPTRGACLARQALVVHVFLNIFPVSKFKNSNNAPCLPVGEDAGAAALPATTSGALGCLAAVSDQSGLHRVFGTYRQVFWKRALPAHSQPPTLVAPNDPRRRFTRARHSGYKVRPWSGFHAWGWCVRSTPAP